MSQTSRVKVMSGGERMSSHTDSSTLPKSTNSNSDHSSQSVSSSNEKVDESDLISGKNNGFQWRSDLYPTKLNISSRIGRKGSTPSSPRTVQYHKEIHVPRGCSPEASELYSNTLKHKHYNPSADGQRVCQEISGHRDWANSFLQYCAHNIFISDLIRDMADGQTLFHLVEVLLGVFMYPIHAKPALEVQKIENTQACLDVLTRHGVIPLQDISPQDVVQANVKTILVLFKYLKQYFDSTPGSPRGQVLLDSSEFMTGSQQTPSYITSYGFKQPTVSPRLFDSTKKDKPTPPSKSFLLMDIEDVALLNWVGQLTGKVVDNYNSFQDGHVLCLLINKLTEGAVPDVVLKHGLPSEKMSLALTVLEEELQVTTDLHPDDVVKLKNVCKISSFLKHLHQVFLKRVQEKQHAMGKEKITRLAPADKESIVHEMERNVEEGYQCQFVATDKGNSMENVASKKGGISNSLHCGVLNNEKNSLQLSQDTALSPSPIAKVKCSEEIGFSSNHTRPHDKSFSNHSEYTSHFLEEIPESSYNTLSGTPIYHPFNPIDVSISNSLDICSVHKKLDSDLFCFDKDVMYGMFPQQSIFYSGTLKYSYKTPQGTKSWKKERENAKLQLSDFSSQLHRLKEEWFRVRNMEVNKALVENYTTNTGDCISPELLTTDEKCEFKKNNLRKTDKTFSDKLSGSFCLMDYIDIKKGTLPPYRTWSKYEKTDDSYCRNITKTVYLNTVSNKQRNQNSPTNAELFRVGVDKRDANGSKPKSPDYQGDKADTEVVKSSHDKQVEQFKSLDEDGQGVYSQKISGIHIYGMTNLVRSSSKKASAVSDTDS